MSLKLKKMSKSNLRGQILQYKKGQWVDKNGKTINGEKDLPQICGYCKRKYTNNHDPCIKNLPGVRNACCGHGDSKQAYVQFEDGRCIRGFDKIFDKEDNKVNTKKE